MSLKALGANWGTREGFDSVESLQNAYKDKIADLRRKASTVLNPEPEPNSSSSSTIPPPLEPPSEAGKAAGTGGTTSSIKPLDSYVDVEKIRALPPKEIEAVWRLRHASDPNSICAVIPIETYQRIAAAARQNPQFILPLPRTTTEEEPTEKEGETQTTTKAGADVHFLQWGFHPPASPPPENASPAQLANTHTSTIIFTQLAAYKLHGAYAQPHTTVTHHLDLVDSKGLVLMLGELTPDSGVTNAEASWLISCVQRFYDFGGQASGKKGDLLKMFNQGDVTNFKVEDLMAEAEKL